MATSVAVVMAPAAAPDASVSTNTTAPALYPAAAPSAPAVSGLLRKSDLTPALTNWAQRWRAVSKPGPGVLVSASTGESDLGTVEQAPKKTNAAAEHRISFN
jgi:hypothetical protein